MSSSRISVRIPAALERKLRNRASLAGMPEGQVVREALSAFLGEAGRIRSAFEVATELGLIGCYRGGPKDLGTNPKHLAGFGRGR